MTIFQQFRQEEKQEKAFPQAVVEHRYIIKSKLDDFTDREEDLIENGNFVKRFYIHLFTCGCGKLLSFETSTKLKPPVAKCMKCNAPLCADCHEKQICRACDEQ